MTGDLLSPDVIQVVVGDHITITVQASEMVYFPHRFLPHGGYSRATLHNDIALIELTEAIQYNEVISPVCLPTGPPPAREICTTTGWGLTMGTANHSYLNELHAPIVSDETCRSPEYWGDIVNSDMVCAGYRKHSVCRGDSGSPLVCNNNGNSPYSLVGITCFTAEYCRNKRGSKPSVFTNVYHYVGWIQENIVTEPLNCSGYIISDDQHCYRYVRNAQNYANAQEICQSENSYLVEIGSKKEQYFLQGLVGGSQVWIGLQDINRTGQWNMWNSQAPVIYSNWHHGQPNRPGRENCGAMLNDGQWHDVSCHARKHFVCERSHYASDPFTRGVTCHMQPAKNCYAYHKEGKNYADAQAACTAEGGHLVEINNQWEQLFLHGMVRGHNIWIGLRDTVRQRKWSTWNSGVPVNYSNWLSGQPEKKTEYCGVLAGDGRWHDFNCATKMRYVCENSHIGLPDQLICNCGIGPVKLMGSSKTGEVDLLCHN